MKQNDVNDSKGIQNDTEMMRSHLKCYKVRQNDRKIKRNDPNGSKWSQNDAKWRKHVKVVQNDAKKKVSTVTKFYRRFFFLKMAPSQHSADTIKLNVAIKTGVVLTTL